VTDEYARLDVIEVTPEVEQTEAIWQETQRKCAHGRPALTHENSGSPQL